MSGVTHIRYVALGVPEYDKEVDFYAGGWGLRKVEASGKISYLATEGDPENFVLRIRESDERRIDVVAFGVPDAGTVDEIAQKLARAGTQLVSEPGTLQTPGGGYGFRFFDPDGRVVEISSDVALREFRVLEPEEAVPTKFSHVVYNTLNAQALVDWYVENLGFTVTGWAGDTFGFLRGSWGDWHHLGIRTGGAINLNHIAFELRGEDEFMRATGRMVESGAPMPRGYHRFQSRSAAGGGAASAYFIDPNGNTTEYNSVQERILDDRCWDPEAIGGNAWHIFHSLNVVDDLQIAGLMGASDPTDAGLWVAPRV